ncbi:TAXI family TRAP transporter solute-binding subunit [Polynucleobacter sp. es-EL-1]|uniref:TAXI family TRAP transporter solute-binding subunit n=1 Tax=Polynucleobacter sp. es-EL-1 TaxID=1855652 RepID=UPI001BFD5A3D|nr:TAXI family TRAP transporter solute-binding subunit [Polynucleobacter sp. es-EL-1]QWE11087.1 ABC transporter substrate-binding protein [Polynucleobacter sp. es-EL-1]
MGSIKQDIKESAFGFAEAAQEKWVDFIQFLKEAWPILLALLIILAGIWLYADPPPPRHVLMATGTEGGSYELMAKKYVDFFEKRGIKLELVKTKGAQENLKRLADRKDPLQAAFVQAGTFNPGGIEGIESLGAVDYEPVWFFYRGPEIKPTNFREANGQMKHFLKGKVSVGAVGSGTHSQAMRILDVSGLQKEAHFLYLPNHEAVSALKKGEIDGAFLVDGYQSENVQALLNDPAIHLAGFERAQAYTHLLPYLHILQVPIGGFSLSRNNPDAEIQLISTTTNLLIDDRMHPALQFLFLEASHAINGKANFFAKRGEFPFFGVSHFPESSVAVHYEKNGSPWLMTFFPFWLAELINRLVFVLLPFCAIAYPALISLPGYRNKRMRRKLNKLYGNLKTYEQELTENFLPSAKNEYLKKLDLLEYEALKLAVPKSMSGDYYALRTSIDYVRNCLNRGVQPYRLQDDESSI